MTDTPLTAEELDAYKDSMADSMVGSLGKPAVLRLFATIAALTERAEWAEQQRALRHEAWREELAKRQALAARVAELEAENARLRGSLDSAGVVK